MCATPFLDDVRRLKMSIRTLNGAGTINDYRARTFLGTTGEGHFPPVNIAYERFSFVPTPGVPGVLMFSTAENNFYYFQYYWEGEKLVVCEDGIRKPANPFSLTKKGGLVIAEGSMLIRAPEAEVGEQRSWLAHTLDVLRYIEGKIDLAELRRRALYFNQRRKTEQSLQRQVRQLHGHVAALTEENTKLEGQFAKLATELREARESNHNWRELFSSQREALEKAWKRNADLEDEIRKAVGWIKTLKANLGWFAKWKLPSTMRTLMFTWPDYVKLCLKIEDKVAS